MGCAACILGSAPAEAVEGPTAAERSAAAEGLVATEPAEGPEAAGLAVEGPTTGGVGP